MKYKSVLLLIAAATATALMAQNPNTDYKFSIKVYNLGRYEESDKYRATNPVTLNFYHDETTSFKILHPTIAMQWRSKRNNFHEIELTDFEWENTGFMTTATNDSIKNNTIVYSDNVSRTTLSARYEFILMPNKKKERKLVPSVGFGISPYYREYVFAPGISSSFRNSEIHAGLKMYMTPRLNYFIGERLFVDVNIPVCLSGAEFSSERTDDPAVQTAGRKVSTLDFNTFPKIFSARVGIGIKL